MATTMCETMCIILLLLLQECVQNDDESVRTNFLVLLFLCCFLSRNDKHGTIYTEVCGFAALDDPSVQRRFNEPLDFQLSGKPTNGIMLADYFYSLRFWENTWITRPMKSRLAEGHGYLRVRRIQPLLVQDTRSSKYVIVTDDIEVLRRTVN